ncbi:MAG: hypothetical protein CMF23_17130 [Ignavibacteriae bacterium]|nr:hypothetical protein [Ignavibacteriota bacterium]
MNADVIKFFHQLSTNKVIEENLIKPLLEKLNKDYYPEGNTLPTVSNFGEIRKLLAERIAELAEKNFDKLINSLYRMDINEKKLHEVLYAKEKENIPSLIADLIIERQVQRIRTQILYKEGKL